jgi:hypothetical protein
VAGPTRQAKANAALSSVGIPLNAIGDLGSAHLARATPLAFLNSTRFPVDRKGRLVAPEASERKKDLPMITCPAVLIDPERHQVLSGEVLEALEFLASARETSPALFCRIGQVAINPELGSILYLEGRGVPVLVGRGHVKRKVAYLATVLRYLDSGQGLTNVKLLELRLDGQVVARLEKTS